MNNTLIPGVLALSLAVPAAAQPEATLDDVLRGLASLTERVERLEQANARLQSENAALLAENDRLAATAEFLENDASVTSKPPAGEVPDAAEPRQTATAAGWASRLSWKADLRYRHENIDAEEAASDQTRHRMRARLAMTAKINDTLTGTVGLATNGGTGDPRSTVQTLGDAWTRKGVGLDLAYVDWTPVPGLGMSFGKMPQPWFKTTGFFFDNDLNPEGIAVRYATGPFFAHAFGYSLSERSTASDATLLGGQFGLTGEIGTVKLTGAVGYFDVGSVRGKVTTTNTLPCLANPAFFGGPFGNTTVPDELGCPTLLHDYDMVEALAQAEMTVADRPLQIWGQFIHNTEADALDTGWLAGLNWGKASSPMSWEFGYAYGVMEKDAQFGQFVDSDFGGGFTDTNGSILRVGFAPARNWVVNGTYYMNNRFVDAPGADESHYDRFQLDFNWNF